MKRYIYCIAILGLSVLIQSIDAQVYQPKSLKDVTLEHFLRHLTSSRALEYVQKSMTLPQDLQDDLINKLEITLNSTLLKLAIPPKPIQLTKKSAISFNTLALDNSGTCALTGNSSGKILVWDLSTSEQPKHKELVHSSPMPPVVALSGDGRLALTSTIHSNTVTVWDLQRPDKPLQSIIYKDLPVQAVALSNDGTKMAVLLQGKKGTRTAACVRVYDLPNIDSSSNEQIIQALKGSVDAKLMSFANVSSVSLNRNGTYACIGLQLDSATSEAFLNRPELAAQGFTLDQGIVLLDITDITAITRIATLVPTNQAILHVQLNPGFCDALVSTPTTLLSVNFTDRTGVTLKEFMKLINNKHPKAFLPGATLNRILICQEGLLRLLNASGTSIILSTPEHTLTAVAISGDGSRILVALADGNLQLWDAPSPKFTLEQLTLIAQFDKLQTEKKSPFLLLQHPVYKKIFQELNAYKQLIQEYYESQAPLNCALQ